MIVLILTNSADPDEMQHYAAFHQDLHWFPKYSFRGLQRVKPEEKIHLIQRIKLPNLLVQKKLYMHTGFVEA